MTTVRRVIVGAALAAAGAACAPRTEPATQPAPATTSTAAAPVRPIPMCDAVSLPSDPAARAHVEAFLRARLRVQDSARAVLARALADSAFPGAYAVVGTAGDGCPTSIGAAVGRIDRAADAPPPDSATLWDLASLTKVVGTTSAVMQLVGSGRVQLDAPVQRYLPEWTGPGRERVTVRHLLSHTSGLPAWRPLYKEATSPESALALVVATQPDTAPGLRYVYSDLNFILLGTVVARLTGEPLDAYDARHVFAPLGMRDTRYRPDARDLARTAPTEFDPWRQRKLRGEVHDENAYALGQVAGHAGLFATGPDLARLARAYLNGALPSGDSTGRRPYLDARVVAEFTRAQDTSVSRRALGWETPTGGNSAGHYLSRRAFGHTGFTGTSLWMDPERDVYIVLLTNRVNPTRMNTRIGRVRVALADAVMQALDAPPVFPAPAPPTSAR